MKVLDRILRYWRIAKARPYIPQGVRVLDIGCGDGVLFRYLRSRIAEGVGIDTDLEKSVDHGTYRLIAGQFPDDLPDTKPFDVITLLAVLEHIPEQEQPKLAQGCASLLKPNGHLIITVPSPLVDRIVPFLRRVPFLYDGTDLEHHYGFDIHKTPTLFSSVGLKLITAKKFELGLNNLFVFQKKA